MTINSPLATLTLSDPEDLALVVSLFVTILSFTLAPLYLLLA